MLNITSGSFQGVAKGATTTGLFVVNHEGSELIYVQFSTDGTTWSEAPTVLGGAVSWAELDRDPWEVAKFTVSLTPTVVGTATLYMRVRLATGNTWGATYSTTITCYQPSGQGFAGVVEQWTGSAWTPAVEFFLPRRFGAVVVAGFGRSSARSKYRINNVEYTCPQNNVGCFFVAFGSGGVVAWTAWVSGAGLLGLDQAENGDIYVLIQAAASNRTFYNQDGTTAYTDVFQSSSSGQLLVAKLFSTGNWSGDRSRVVFTGTQSMGTPQIRCGTNRVVVAGPISTTVTALTSAGTSVAVGTRSVTTAYALGLSASNLSHVWGQVWTRGLFHRLVTSLDDRAYVATYDSTSNPTVATVVAPNAGGIARISSSGGLLGHEGWPPNAGTATHGGLHLAVDIDNNLYLLAKPQATSASGVRNYADGAVSLSTTAIGFSVVLWKRNSSGTTTGAVVVQEGITGQSRAESLSLAVDGSVLAAITAAQFQDTTSGTKIIQIATAGMTGDWVARHFFSNGDVTNVVFAAVARDSQGNAVYVCDVGTDLNGSNNFVNFDSLTPVSKPANLRVISLANGVWETFESSDGATPPGNPLDAPSSDNWPATLQESVPLSSTIVGYDPDQVVGTAELEVWNPATKTWISNPSTLEFTGKGTLSVMFSGSLEIGAIVSFAPVDKWFGTLRVLARWKVTAATTRTSALTEFKTIYTNIPEGPSHPEGEMPDVLEDNPSIGTWQFATDPDNVGTYTWQLSPQTSKPENWDTLYPPAQYPNGQPDWHTTTGSTVTVLDENQPVGVATVLSQSNQNKSASIQFTPNAHWNGSASFDLRVSNGVWSDWVTAFVQVEPVEDIPSALIGDAVDTDEDTPVEFDLTWEDPDVDPADGSGAYTIELAAVEEGSSGWTPVAWTESGEIDTELAVIRVLEMASDALKVTIRVEPKANLSGVYRFAARVRQDDQAVGENQEPQHLYGASRVLSANIGTVPDAPATVQGRMPFAKWGQTVQGEFTTFDPDGDESYTFEIATAEVGPWGSVINYTTGVNLEVIDGDDSDLAAKVRMTQTPPGASVQLYDFWIRVVDSTDLASTPVRVVGGIGAPSTFAWIQRPIRTPGGGGGGGGGGVSVVENRSPLRGFTSLSFTESLDGSGYAEIEMSVDEMVRRANAIGVSPLMFAEAGAVELYLAIGGTSVFCGPITEVSWQTASATVRISAAGLLNYFETREIETQQAFVADDISSIVSDLVMDSQAAPYGDLGIGDATSPAGVNATVTFEAGTRITDALGQLAELVDAPEIWIDADRQLHASPTRGVDNRSRVRITSGMADVAQWTARKDGVVTVARVIGAEYNGATYEGSYSSSSGMAIYGRVERTFSAPQLLSNAECSLLAQRIVESSQVQVQSISLSMLLTSDAPFTFTDLGVGDVITVDLVDRQLGQILGAYRIINREASLVEEASGTYQISLDLEPARYVNGKLVGSRSRHNPAVLTELSRLALEQRQA